MDALSRLIQLARPESRLDLRCLFEGAFSVDHAQQQDDLEASFHLLLEGECVIETADGRRLTLRAGDFVLFPSGAAHRIRDRGTASPRSPLTQSHDGMLPLRRNGSGRPDVDLLCGRFVYAPGAAALLTQALPDPLHVSLAGAQSITVLHTLIALMRTEVDQRLPGALAIVTALSQALFALALRAHGEQATTAPGVLTLLADARLGPSVHAMLAEPGRAWTIAELGALAAMSRATYARHFGDKAGMTVASFLTELRMTIASDLLIHTERSAADIGMEIGYQSEAAFGKAFRQNQGLSPGRYRRQHRAAA
ncbi:AraC family transcriptional regulator [Neisseriaceae bacterium JH1-16]|nr:AraC family transcriptional regulator [Neisseriaceae bacterium JH1-16]